MREISFSVVNSFTDNPFEGNPAAVVLYADTLDDEMMQRIARQFNLVETVFVLPTTDGHAFDFELRYFTPTEEVPIAVHPTVAAFVALYESGELDIAGTDYTVKTQAGIHRINTNPEEQVFMVEAVQPKFYPIIEQRRMVADAFGLEVEDLLPQLPIQPVDTGLGHLIVPVKSLQALMKAKRNIAELKKLCSAYGVREAQLFTFEVYDQNYDIHTRNICPREGIEDPGCGVGNAALGAYLLKHTGQGQTEMRIQAEQGVLTHMPCVIHIHSYYQKDEMHVYVGGKGKTMITGKLRLE